MSNITQTELNLQGLLIHPECQRKLNPNWANHLAKNWDDRSCQTIDVMVVSGKSYVVDGQHRVKAAQINGLQTLPAKVQYGCTEQDLAAAFHGINTGRKGAPTSAKFVAEAKKGDKVAQQCLRIVDNWAVRDEFKGWTTLNKMFKTYKRSEANVDWHMDLYYQLFGAYDTQFTNKALMTLFKFIDRYGGCGDLNKAHPNFSLNRLKYVVSKNITCIEDWKDFIWDNHDHNRGSGKQREDYVLNKLIDLYNKGLQPHKRLT